MSKEDGKPVAAVPNSCSLLRGVWLDGNQCLNPKASRWGNLIMPTSCCADACVCGLSLWPWGTTRLQKFRPLHPRHIWRQVRRRSFPTDFQQHPITAGVEELFDWKRDDATVVVLEGTPLENASPHSIANKKATMDAARERDERGRDIFSSCQSERLSHLWT